MSDSIEKIKKNRRRTLLKKELLAAGSCIGKSARQRRGKDCVCSRGAS